MMFLILCQQNDSYCTTKKSGILIILAGGRLDQDVQYIFFLGLSLRLPEKMELFSRSSFFYFCARSSLRTESTMRNMPRFFGPKTQYVPLRHKRSQTDQQYAPISTITSKLFCSQFASFHEGIKNSVLLSHYSKAVRLHTNPPRLGSQV